MSLTEGASAPLVSVVMAVYNGASGLDATLASILTQADCDFELIVVDDGSTDATAEILARVSARDSRLRILTQANAGLTRALIAGCAVARGRFIARQDAGDISRPGRLRAQADYLLAHPDVSVVASSVRFEAPGGEWLYDYTPAARIKIPLDIEGFGAPPLVATMFRRDSYLRCGGFQPVFAVAQDVDLWLRLDETGPCHGLTDVHYSAPMTLGGISSRRRTEQLKLVKLAIACAKCRRDGGNDAPLLAAFVATPRQCTPMTRRERARFHYFIASCLRSHDLEGARRYYRLVLTDNPFHLKALLRIMTAS